MEIDQTPSPRELWALFQEQQAFMEKQQERVVHLEAQLEKQHLAQRALTNPEREPEERHVGKRRRMSRAGLLKVAAVGVAGLAGAGALSGTQEAAAAGTDGDVGLGATNTTGANNSANNQTTILAAAGMTGSAVLRVDAYNGGANSTNLDGISGVGSGAFSGVSGYGGANGGPGLFAVGGPGTTGVIGLTGESPRPASTNLVSGVYGGSNDQVGVYGRSSHWAGVIGEGGVGVIGSGVGGDGVRGSSDSYFDLAATGTGRLWLRPQSGVGALTSGVHDLGELIIDGQGVLYVCTATGTPGTWVPLMHGNSNNGTSDTLLTKVSTQQYTLQNSDGTTWMDMDTTNLALTFTPQQNSLAIISGNSDLWTSNAGYNQDLGIRLSGGSYPSTAGQPEAWKESGGSAGTFSPNAAFVQTVHQLIAGTAYTITLVWKTNKSAPGATIWAGAGPIGGKFSPTRLTVSLVPTP